jgi:glycosyltransferase involved in cell wall biosynthesis
MTIDSLKECIRTDLILYDVTRLLTRRSEPFATGIDRVDLHFALGLAESSPERIVFVAQRGSSGVIIDRDLMVRFMRSVQESWTDSTKRDPTFSRRFEHLGLVGNIEGPLSFELDRLRPMSAGERLAYFRTLLAKGDAYRVLPDGVAKLHAISPLASLPLLLLPSVAPQLANEIWRQWRKLRVQLRTNLGRDLADGLSLELAGRTATYFVCSHHGFARKPGFLQRLRDVMRLDVVAYIHDIIPIQFPEYIRPQQLGQFERYLVEIVAAGGRFICNSTDTAANLEAYIGEQGWNAPIVATIRPQFEIETKSVGAPSPEIARLIETTAPYFITVGTIEPRKNHLLLLHLWRHLANSGLDPVPHLHIVGRRGWENENIVDLLERSPAIRRHVSEHDGLDDASLFHLMKRAKAVLLPSFAEGLGLPILEAAALGVPVIASDLPVFRELALDGVTLLDPLDTPGWERACLAASKASRAVAEPRVCEVEPV